MCEYITTCGLIVSFYIKLSSSDTICFTSVHVVFNFCSTGNHQSYLNKYNTQYLGPSGQNLTPPGAQPNPRTTTSPPELAHVIHQLSKSAMEDSLPPILQLTPKGNGTGYGLSLDFEEWLQSSMDSPQGAK